MLPLKIERFNKWLSTLATKNNKPLLRIVWSSDEFEVRKGPFRSYTPSGIFLKEVKGPRKVHKYPQHQDRWIMEMQVDMIDKDVVGTIQGNNYEPFYVFQDSNGEFLRPEKKVVEFLAYNVINPEKAFPSDLKDEEKKERLDYLKRNMDIVDDLTPTLPSMLKSGEAVFVDSTKRKEVT